MDMQVIYKSQSLDQLGNQFKIEFAYRKLW